MHSIDRDDADRLIADAAATPLVGWDFSALDGRVVTEPLPWDYVALARGAVTRAARVLDIDTGGGEVLAQLGVPAGSLAVEPYPPNVGVAEKRLRPLGVEVRPRVDGALPVEDASVDLVLNRHGALDLVEVARVLERGGTFLSQQVGAANDAQLSAALGAPSPGVRSADELEAVVGAMRAAGFDVARAQHATSTSRYLDIGAVVLQLRLVGWQVPGFDVDRHRDELLAVHDVIATRGAFVVTSHRLLLQDLRVR